MTYHASGIVLRREDWRETGRMYFLYTREHGKVMAVGRGTRKILSKLGPHLEPYSRTDLFLARGRRYETLCGASLVRSSEPLAFFDERYAAAAFAAEAFDQLVKWAAPDEELFDLFDGFLASVSASAPGEAPDLLAGFLWRFLERMGYGPRLEACASCSRDVAARPPAGGETAALFLPRSGHVVCGACRPHERDLAGAEPLPEDALAELRRLFSETRESRVRHPSNRLAGLAFLEAHLDRPLAAAPPFKAPLSEAGKTLTMAA